MAVMDSTLIVLSSCVLRGRETGAGRLHLLQYVGGKGLCHGQW